jgi:GGDEF domain-containing protein
LNGLKQCNDQGGHAAGDKLLQKASELLRKEFDGYEIYRAGGDSIDLRRCMHIADSAMYADKKAYYEAHPKK